MVIESMASQGKEPTFCMGDDTPLSVLSTKGHLIYDYFKQRFAQVRRLGQEYLIGSCAPVQKICTIPLSCCVQQWIGLTVSGAFKKFWTFHGEGKTGVLKETIVLCTCPGYQPSY
jgi:hypothetical protein